MLGDSRACRPFGYLQDLRRSFRLVYSQSVSLRSAGFLSTDSAAHWRYIQSMSAPTTGPIQPDILARSAMTSEARSSFSGLVLPVRSITIMRVETSPNKSLQPTPVGVVSSADAGHVVDPAWLSFCR